MPYILLVGSEEPTHQCLLERLKSLKGTYVKLARGLSNVKQTVSEEQIDIIVYPDNISQEMKRDSYEMVRKLQPMCLHLHVTPYEMPDYCDPSGRLLETRLAYEMNKQHRSSLNNPYESSDKHGAQTSRREADNQDDYLLEQNDIDELLGEVSSTGNSAKR